MTTHTSTKDATFVQRVSVEIEVVVPVEDTDISTLTTDAVQEAAERYVAKHLGPLAGAVTELYARRGPTGYRYFYPGTAVETEAAVPLRVSLADLLAD